MKILSVKLAERSYPIYIGSGLLQQKELLLQHIPRKQLMIVTNTTVAQYYLHTLKALVENCKHDTLILPDGEEHKNLDTLNTIITALLEKQHDRHTTLVALGGGVIGDITGFAAACYQRGIRFIQIPTTLLAQVDSSVGGKTAVNHKLGKNMIGAFHQPECVISDTRVLTTLPDRELSAGLAEVIKYGLIRDKPFFSWLCENMQQLLDKNPAALSYAIERSCINKAEIVAQDERETNIRALLNLGHTFGHAIETHQEYRNWLHGEAIAAGIVIAAKLSQLRGWLKQSDINAITGLLKEARLPILPPAELSPDTFVELMQRDKKVADGKLRLILLKQIGTAVISDDTEKTLLLKCLEDVRDRPH